MASISIDVGLDEFEDDEILAAALAIIVDRKSPGRLTTYEQELVAKIAAALEVHGSDERPTTAASIKSMDELVRLVNDHPNMYHFGRAA